MNRISVYKMISHYSSSWCDIYWMTLPFCPKGKITDVISSPQLGDYKLRELSRWLRGRMLRMEAEEVLGVLHGTRHGWIQKNLSVFSGAQTSEHPWSREKEWEAWPSTSLWEAVTEAQPAKLLSVHSKLFRDDQKLNSFQLMEWK